MTADPVRLWQKWQDSTQPGGPGRSRARPPCGSTRSSHDPHQPTARGGHPGHPADPVRAGAVRRPTRRPGPDRRAERPDPQLRRSGPRRPVAGRRPGGPRAGQGRGRRPDGPQHPGVRGRVPRRGLRRWGRDHCQPHLYRARGANPAARLRRPDAGDHRDVPRGRPGRHRGHRRDRDLPARRGPRGRHRGGPPDPAVRCPAGRAGAGHPRRPGVPALLLGHDGGLEGGHAHPPQPGGQHRPGGTHLAAAGG